MDKLRALCESTFAQGELDMLDKAIAFAKQAHEGQLRESGEPYYVHPEAVGILLYNMGMDASTIIAGLLHDTIEDCGVALEALRSEFTTDIAEMVDGVTKLTQSGNYSISSKEDRQAENMRKMFMAIARDVRVVIIKLADRLHNMRTLEYCDPDKRMRKAKETLEVYAPLAQRFGMGAVKVELEDIAFSFLYPEEYQHLKDVIEPKQRERLVVLETSMRAIQEQLDAIGLKAEVSGRRKHLYSIYRKLAAQGNNIDKIYDLIAIRVIVDTIKDCYAALGQIHAMWPPMPGRFKDYIGMPKTNMYRSLHTTLFSESGMPFEVQIRTWEMHRNAEYGIAAHWKYKEGRNTAAQDDMDNKLAWLRAALEYENLADNTKEFVENVRRDFFADFVFVLTPKGEIIDLPAGSTPVDFAYRIHTNVGNHTQHAKVNGAIVKLDYKLANHDVVEIITSPQASPNRDWLRFVKTQQAKGKIRNWFKKANREENVQRGREMLQDASSRQGYALAELLTPESVETVLKQHNMASTDDIYAAIGYGSITTNQILNKLIGLFKKEQYRLEREESAAADGNGPACTVRQGVRVFGSSNMAVRFAQCCNPVPGDEIMGYITRGRGVSVHRVSCPNAANLLKEDERIVAVEWAGTGKAHYPVTVLVKATERAGLLVDVYQTLLNLNISIKAVSAGFDAEGKVALYSTFDVSDASHLDHILKLLRRITSVESVIRTN
ncbi:MAG: bifunctional (p)ppGpp synthetase/guanosine-3',5'-bis(diphosphate) 3'-pyrophosphohydrolase [Clostridia bacterium]|nr:bifunctional (p)ppGpp synthetase/guanosine-3',5'-bis(diphosphate) 3'-pyrophosphohydrolase [Clostridia bacterium]